MVMSKTSQQFKKWETLRIVPDEFLTDNFLPEKVTRISR